MNSNEKEDAYKQFSKEAEEYEKQYKESDLINFYPEHQYRLQIFLDCLKTINPSNILDIGCGSGMPLISILEQGYNINGFDFSDEMVAQARKNLSIMGFDPNRVTKNNMEDIQGIAYSEYDCIIALGSLYYSRDFNKTINAISALLPQKGHLIFSLRNELFSLFSLNEYSADYFSSKLIPIEKLSNDLKSSVNELLQKRFAPEQIVQKFKTVDNKGIYSILHNPLTVADEILTPNNLKLENVYYYHYHALPPVFEHTDTKIFRELSSQMEKPKDWRGTFMCSSFVVHATKID